METATNRKVKAIFRNGHFEPVENVELEEGAVVEVVLPQRKRAKSGAAWKAFIGSMKPEEVTEFDRYIDSEFGKVDDEVWG